jgi:hypothetical protein
MIRARALVCDHPGCDRRILGYGGPRAKRARTLRRRALGEGWTRTENGTDLCPDHRIASPTDTGEGRMAEPGGE